MKPKKITQKQAQKLYNACIDLIRGYTTGECYETRNPYSRKNVQNGLLVLSEINGADKYDAADADKFFDILPN